MWTVKFQMFKLVLEKAEEPEIKLPTSAGSLKKQESTRKTSIFALLTKPKPFTVWITTNCGKFLKRWEYQTTLPASWETCLKVRFYYENSKNLVVTKGWHIEKQRHYFANKGPSSQGYGFSSGHVRMWELDYEESWAPKQQL